MSASLDRNSLGTDAMIYAAEGGVPWHRGGNPITGEALQDLDAAMKMGGVDFQVEKVAHYVLIPATSEAKGVFSHPELGWVRPVESTDGYSIIRTDRNEVIGTVGEVYTPLQGRDACEPIRPVLEDGLALIETAGSLRGGRQCWMMLRFDTDAIIARAKEMVSADKTVTTVTKAEIKALESALRDEAGGEILPYGLLSWDHTGKRKAILKETGVRTVCWNTLELALNSSEGGISVAVPHIKSVADDWKAATDALFGNLVMRFIGMANYRTLLKRTKLDDPTFVDLVLEATIPVKQLEEKIRRRDGTAFTVTSLEKSTAKRNRIRDLWTTGKGQVGDHSAWEAYQGTIEFIDHDPEALPTNGDRIQSLMDGTLKKAKGKVFRNLMAYSVNQTANEALVGRMVGRSTAPVVEELLLASSAN